MPAKQNPSSSPALTPQAYWRNPASQSLIRQAIEQSSTTPGSFLPNNEHINSEALKKIQHLSTLFEHSIKNSYKEEESGNQRDHINAKIRAELSTLYRSISGNTNSMNKFNNNSMNNYNNNYFNSGGSISKDFLCGHNLGPSTNINGSRPSIVTPPSPLPTSNNKASGLSTDRTNMLAGLNSLAASGIIPSNDTKKCLDKLRGPDGQLPQRLRDLPPNLIEQISNEIMDRDPNVRWDDIAGLQQVKECVTEMGIWPLLRPDIFQGCRSPGRGLLLFGPPGTGKTMIGKAIAGEAKATFFYVSASSLTGRWWGDAEKLVRALFGVASCRQPAVIFVDEIDSLLSKRKSYGENEASRKLKTQLFIEMEGFDSENDQILFIGATNRPLDLDEAARRRLTKRFYIPLPSSEARAWIVKNLLEKDGLFKLSKEDLDSICESTEGSDMKNLVKDASMGPVREALKQGMEITKLNKEDMRPVSLQDFEKSLQVVRSSVSLDELGAYEDWNDKFGSLSTIETCDSVDRHRKKMRADAYSTIYI